MEKAINIESLKVLSVFLPDDSGWMKQYEEAKEYFAAQGLDVYWVEGIHAEKWGLQSRHIFLLDGRPEEQYYIGIGGVGGFLSWYVLYHIMKAMNHSHYFLLESDALFIDGWKEKLEQALKDVPEDFDYLFVGSCCAMDKEPVHVKGDVYEFPYRGEEKWQYYPQCGHANIIARKCVQLLIDTQRDVGSQGDISLIRYAFPKLKIYAILPRLAEQKNTSLAP